MLQLCGINLGKRQQELNVEIYKATSSGIDFNLIETLEEQSDVDRLYKIEVASAYRNVGFMIENLKCGDSVYIARVLKCTWLYEKDYSCTINPDYLHCEVFPFMSMKNKKKMLTTISMHVRDVNRALDFYKYCAADITLDKIALKFLIWTSEDNKMEYIQNTEITVSVLHSKIFIHIIGHSYYLFEAFLAKLKKKAHQSYIDKKLHEFSYLYTTSNERYLKLLEEYSVLDTLSYYASQVFKLGLRISKHIILNHKDRVLGNPELYFRWLNINIIEKYSSVQDARLYAVNLLPTSATSFWQMNFYNTYKAIFQLLPQNEIYSFLKQIFLEKYTKEPFEMSKEFYNLKYYQLLTDEEKEVWALNHIKQSDELLGPNRDYLWYQFVNYDLAFKEIKKYTYVTNDRSKRADIINILVDCVKNEEQLESLLRYYYERHVNEVEDVKLKFINKIIAQKNVYKLSESCWAIFNKLLHSGYESHRFNEYKTIAIFYNIIHDKPIPRTLEDYIITSDNACNMPNLKELKNKLSDKEITLIYKYFIDLCTSKMKDLDKQTYDDKVKSDAGNIISFIVPVIHTFGKSINDCPDIVLKYMKMDNKYKYHFHIPKPVQKITEAKLLRLLKLDSELLLKTLTEPNCLSSSIKINHILKKIRIYFSHDIAQKFLSWCNQWLLEGSGVRNKYQLLDTIIVSLFYLGSDEDKISLISKYVPKDPKISHDTMDKQTLAIQKCICTYVHYSRPPVPLNIVLPYIKGDYLHYCLPILNSYSAHLARPQCLKFISSILDNPVSVQKHGLRLAFKNFGMEDLASLIVNVWKTTKNISLRIIIYKSLFNKIRIVNEYSQSKLYDILKILTLGLNENDDDILFSLLPSFNLSRYKGDFLESVWRMMENWTEKSSTNIERKYVIVKTIFSNFDIMNKEFCYSKIIDEFVESMLINKDMGRVYDKNEVNDLIDAKWNLTAKYIIHIHDVEKSLELVNRILNVCIEMIDNGIYTSRKFMFKFIKKICQLSYLPNNIANSSGIPVIEYVLRLLTESLPMKQIYPLYIELNVIIISRKVTEPNKFNYNENEMTDIANRLATTFMEYLEDVKNKNLIYSSFYNVIASSLYNAIWKVFCLTDLNHEAVVTLVSSHLAEASLQETRLIALMMLPKDPPEHYASIWKGTIEKIQRWENDELDAYICEHFILDAV